MLGIRDAEWVCARWGAGVSKTLVRCLALSTLALFLGLAQASSVSFDPPTVLVVVGAPGEDEYAKNFSSWAGLWEKAALQAAAKLLTVGLQTNELSTDRALLQNALDKEPKEGTAELWLVLIGHGTFDGKEAKFNLRGPDFSATDLRQWLQPFRRPLAVIDTSSASGPFVNKLSAAGRVVITATKSGQEQNYARFGGYLAEAMADPKADLDKDGQTSLLEAFLIAARRTSEFYQLEGRLATEHALLDDNGDGLGTPADWFRGIRAVKKAQDGAALDGLRAHQFHLIHSEAEQKMPSPLRARRDELELAIAKLREVKSNLDEEEYYRRLENLLLEMARLYEKGAAESK
jgi:hypothetical protein